MENKKYISTKFSNYEKVNDEFVKCTVSVNSYEQVANGTKFRKEAIERAFPTLNYAPVIGYFKEGDFTNHGIEYVIDDEGISEVVKTIPFGVVIKDSQRWGKLQKPNGEFEEYVLIDCYLWGRYKEAIDKVMENRCNQSMEVLINSAEYNLDEGYYDVTDFSYSAICILGENTQPAFNLAKIRTSDKFSKDDFKACYSKMTEALDKFLNFEEGGIEVEDNKELEAVEVEETPVVEEQIEEVVAETVVEEIEPIVETEEEFAKKKKCEDETDEDEVENPKKEEDGSEEDDDFAKKKKCEQEDFEAKYNEVVNELNELKAKYVDLEATYTALNEEVVGLREFKSNIETKEYQAEVDAMLEKYSELEDVQGYSEIIKDKYSMEIDKLETAIKVFAFDNGVVLGKKTKKNFAKKDTTIVFEKDTVETTIKESAWDDILGKYVSK